MGSTLLLTMLAAASVHTRLSTDKGPVHVAIPPRGAAVTVVYVHGFRTHVDEAWVHHRLAAQLEGIDAALVAPEAPAGPEDEVLWPDLDALLATVERGLGADLPHDVIAVGHSGGYLTLMEWTRSPRVIAMALLDAFYTRARTWERWLDRDEGHRLYVLAASTAWRSEAFCRRHRGDAQVTCEASRWSHMKIVTGGEALPQVLRALVPDKELSQREPLDRRTTVPC